MKKYKVGDLLRDEWNDTLWLVMEVWTGIKSRQGIVIRRYSRGITYRNSGYSKDYALVCRPHSSKKSEVIL